MNKYFYYLSIIFILFGFSVTTYAQGLNAFKLPNGLSVFIWEDPNASEVHGMVVCNAGAKEDPENLTGLAHYLEHLMFKGTQTIGALDWTKEKPIYEQIIARYDAMAAETDPIKKEEINKEINKLTVEASKYGLTNEFSALTEGMGGFKLNASTSLDRTVYFNSFAPGETYKWLELNSERLINPVFRAFQTELETVFEEYNLYQNNSQMQIFELTNEAIFPNHPYARPIIGYPDHLKNPQISKLIEFYNQWYVPENMALILAGNIKTSEVIPMIKEKFGRLEKRPAPQKKSYPEEKLLGKKEIKSKIGRIPEIRLGFPGVPMGHTDEIPLYVCSLILSNSSKTGLLDKLTLEGDFMYAFSHNYVLADQGRILIGAAPSYDAAQQRFVSLGSIEKLVLREMKKLQNGEFEDWLVESIKNEMIRQYDLDMEHPDKVTELICEAFYSGQDPRQILDYKDKVASLSTEKIKEVARKYFGENYYALVIEKGKLPKKEKLEKPEYDPLTPPRNAQSDYAKLFEIMPVKYQAPRFIDFNSVQQKAINEKSKIFYTQNKENNIFSLTLKYGIGTDKVPNLDLAVNLMNNAGIMGSMKAQQVKQEFSNLGAECNFKVNDSYLIIEMIGFEENLTESCNLLTRQILFPELDEKQLNTIIGQEYHSRQLEKELTQSLSNALAQYLLYKDKSGYIDRLQLNDILDLSIGKLTGEFQRATDYEAEIHYTGSMPFDEVYEILSKNLPLKDGEKDSTSPEVKERAQYTENIIYFLPDKEAQQANVYFFFECNTYNIKDEVSHNAFNQYFTGGFTSILLQEIREYRSMAYTTYGFVTNPPKAGENTYFTGYIGTQGDKVIDALEIYTGLLRDMPQYTDRVPALKNYLKEYAITARPHFRELSQTIESWKLRGYTSDPSQINMDKINSLNFSGIEDFYKQNVQTRPWAIAITGDPNQIDTKALEKYGKVIRLNSSKLFSDK